eukprot:scaffold108933_cov31-Tisochrysis_lutea.AAC.4
MCAGAVEGANTPPTRRAAVVRGQLPITSASHVWVVLLCQRAISLLHLLGGGARAEAEERVRLAHA